MMTQDVWEVIWLSLQVTTVSVLIGMLLGIPTGTFLGLYTFRGKRLVVALIYTCMGLPPVLVGVVVYMLLSRYGPLGALGLLFTPEAMIIAQIVLVTPILAGLTMSAVQAKERAYWETAKSLGASPVQMMLTIVKEARGGIWSGVAAAYGRAISEVGAVMLVGGNIEHHTRVMTTAIILETRTGNFTAGLQLGLVLLAISFLFNSFLMAGVLNQMRNGRR
ncbi:MULTISPECIES: ABC transporter permease [Brevibacillus]|uniref:ABC transporter permease subunit n=1 Tax=Brevibacillus invocatus TaxID=173959 RepID=A0A3M8C779_9BACL|nr:MULTISPECIES: ABC transporter permease [Brevibacillus]MCM3081415.1 ABC transporter permease [Brevibacillus invocatus]MCM3431808.1 ABC transporter permease [Brevibacillus invocatus]MDH4619286.1 ABC transporter permease [Brevibacillus sp. AY1]RNB71554.1 ABC transporter permease subunit [Brevibacillus invocatus]